MDKRNLTLTDRQAKVMQLIRLSISTFGLPPSRRELLDDLEDVTSLSTVQGHLEALQRKGRIKLLPLARGIIVLPNE